MTPIPCTQLPFAGMSPESVAVRVAYVDRKSAKAVSRFREPLP